MVALAVSSLGSSTNRSFTALRALFPGADPASSASAQPAEKKAVSPKGTLAGWTGVPLLYRYVLGEVITPFAVALIILTGMLFLARILKLIDLVVNKNVPLTDMLLLFSYVVPGFLEVAIPMALLLGTLIAFSRLSADSEIVVMRSIGVSLKQLVRPVMFVAFFAFCVSMTLGFWVRPWANYRLSIGLFEIVKLRTSAGLAPGIFNDFGPLTIYAEKVEEQSGRLTNVIIADRRNADTNRNFIAKYGQVVSDNEEQSLALQLYDGAIQEGSGLDFNVTTFEINKLRLPASELLDEDPSKEGKRSNELLISELLAATSRLAAMGDNISEDDRLQLARYRVEFQKRLVIPFSAFCVALAAMALGIQPTRGGRTWGLSANISLGISLILAYYLMLAFASAISSQGRMAAWTVLWIPNIAVSMLGIYLLRQIGSERWQAVSQAISDLGTRIGRRLGMSERLS